MPGASPGLHVEKNDNKSPDSPWRRFPDFVGYLKKKRSVVNVRSTAAARDMSPHSTPTG